MAETISKLMLRIGLSFDELNKDFIKAESTLKSNMERLSRENTLVKLRAQVDLASVTDAAQRLKIQQEALNKQLENQRARIQLTTVAWKEATQRTGEHSKQAQQTAIAIEREKLKLIELEQELKKVADQQKSLPKADNNLVAGYKGLKSNISSAYNGSIGELANKFNELSTASQSADSAITKTLEIVGSIQHPAGKAAAALAAVPLVLRGIENSIINTTKAAAAAGDSVYVMSRGFQMSIADTAKFTTNCKVAGVEVNDLASTVKRLQQSVLRAGNSGNAVTKMLDKYGVSVYDANGHLKNLNDMTMALSKGLKKAQEEGNGAAFVLTAFRNASGDAITAIEDWADVNEQAATIVKNGLANPVLAHSVQGNINAMNQQAAQLNASFASILLPVANEIIPRVTDRMGDLVQFLADNKDEIKSFGEALGKFFGSIEDGADMAFSAIKILHDGLKKLKIEPEQRELEIKTSFNLNPKDNFELYRQIQESFTLTDPTYFAPMLKTLEDTKQQVKEKTTEIIKDIHNVSMALEMERASNENKNLGFAGASTAALERIDDHFEEKLEAARAALNKTRAFSDELYKITHNEYENKKMDLLNWRQELLNNEETTAEQRVLVEKIYAEKSKQIEQDRQQKIDEIREEIASKNRTDLENQIAEIKKNKERRIQAGLPAIEAEKAAEQEKYQAIRQLEEEFAEARDSIHQTELEKRLAQIDKEKEAWIQKGIDEVKATELAEQQKVEAARNAAMNVLKSQLKDYRAFRDGGYEVLQQRMLAQLRKAGITDIDLQINPQQLQDFLSAQKNIQDNFLPNIQNFTADINGSLNEAAENVKNINPSLDEAKNNLSEITEPLAEFKANLSDMATPIADFKENFSAIAESVVELPTLFDSLAESVLSFIDTIKTLPEMPSIEESAIDQNIGTSSLQSTIDSINATILENNNDIRAVQNQLNEAINQLSQMLPAVSSTHNSLSAVKTALDKVADIKVSTPTVNITQNVNEPHAWNNELIQELADKVADKMKNEIIYAIKGSYGY